MLQVKKHIRGLTTMINVIPSGNYLVIEAWNKHCSIRVAEKNTRVLYRLIKASFRLYLKTIKTLLNGNKTTSKAQRPGPYRT